MSFRFSLFAIVLLCWSEKLIAQNDNYVIGNYITSKRDTIGCRILTYKKKNRSNEYNKLEIIDSLGRVFSHYPEDMIGYFKEGAFFKSNFTIVDGKKVWFFMKLLENGRIELYERDRIIEDPIFKYFFKPKTQTGGYYTFDPDQIGFTNEEKPIAISQENNAFGNFPIIQAKDLEGKFKQNMVRIVGDCTLVRNKILNGFYTSSSLRSIIKDYNRNNCN